MIDTLLSYIAPHLCCGCNKMGSLLCDNCKYNITNESLNECVECSKAVIDNTCGQCDLPYERSWCVGERDGILREIIDRYKFENTKAGCETLADLLDETISHLPLQTIVVPIPTITAHIRQRGYDHALLLANKFAKKRSLSVQKVLSRTANTTQRGASRKQRRLQAEQAFTVRKTLYADTPYLIVDDITTTGATLRYAAEALRDAGAKIIWVAVVAKQPLD
jgi:ComF family protein